MRSLRFARLNFRTKLSDFQEESSQFEERRQKLLEIIDYKTNLAPLLENSDVENDNVEWVFGEISSDEEYIYGKIGKNRDYSRTKPDDRKEGFVQEKIDDTDLARFLIDIKSSILVYEYRRNVGKKSPYRVIRDAYNEKFEPEDKIKIHLITDKREFIKRINEMEKITDLKLKNLEPSNPDSSKIAESMDEFIEGGGIEDLLLEAEGNEETGIKLDERPLLNSGIHHANEGHGSAEVEGEDKEGEKQSVATDEVPLKAKIESDRQEEKENIKEMLEEAEEAHKSLKESSEE